ncbi:hypothetical protein BDQ12DRAFT_685266 [Crucibulum laeve]|uniref:Uncharacterized protein n=1 Tax=Crucibulum laeve TaxID=68775 RepID=A0A5C3LZT8_9AGAR|nr:hypothetical protein BDQ12DRAFT_685266 [Crucibulum laeve]
MLTFPTMVEDLSTNFCGDSKEASGFKLIIIESPQFEFFCIHHGLTALILVHGSRRGICVCILIVSTRIISMH